MTAPLKLDPETKTILEQIKNCEEAARILDGVRPEDYDQDKCEICAADTFAVTLCT
jgi:hypothetical protein